jgi:hypothetical protein
MKKVFTLVLALISMFSIAQTTKMGDYHLNQNYKLDTKGTITLTSSDANVFITGSARADVHLKIDRVIEAHGFVFGDQEFSVDVNEVNGNLSIRERSGSGSIGVVGSIHEKYTINIEAPEGASLVLRGDDGDYYIKTVHGSMDINLDDADVELTGCKGNDFRFRLDDGDLTMDEGRGTLDVDADDADVVIRNGKFEKIMADVDDGDFVVETTLTDAGEYFIAGQDGLISLTILGGGGKFDVRHDDARLITEGSFNEVERSEERSTLTLAKGNAKINIRADDGRIKLSSR